MITVLEELIIFAITPIGFTVLMLLLLFSQYLILKSVIEDAKIVLAYIKNLKSIFTKTPITQQVLINTLNYEMHIKKWVSGLFPKFQ